MALIILLAALGVAGQCIHPLTRAGTGKAYYGVGALAGWAVMLAFAEGWGAGEPAGPLLLLLHWGLLLLGCVRNAAAYGRRRRAEEFVHSRYMGHESFKGAAVVVPAALAGLFALTDSPGCAAYVLVLGACGLIVPTVVDAQAERETDRMIDANIEMHARREHYRRRTRGM